MAVRGCKMVEKNWTKLIVEIVCQIFFFLHTRHIILSTETRQITVTNKLRCLILSTGSFGLGGEQVDCVNMRNSSARKYCTGSFFALFFRPSVLLINSYGSGPGRSFSFLLLYLDSNFKSLLCDLSCQLVLNVSFIH